MIKARNINKGFGVLLIYWALFIIYMIYDRRLILIPEDSIELIVLAITLITVILIFGHYLSDEYKILLSTSSFLYSTWVMYWRIEHYRGSKIIHILLICVPLISTIINDFFQKSKTKESYFAKGIMISILIGICIIITAFLLTHIIFFFLF